MISPCNENDRLESVLFRHATGKKRIFKGGSGLAAGNEFQTSATPAFLMDCSKLFSLPEVMTMRSEYPSFDELIGRLFTTRPASRKDHDQIGPFNVCVFWNETGKKEIIRNGNSDNPPKQKPTYLHFRFGLNPSDKKPPCNPIKPFIP